MRHGSVKVTWKDNDDSESVNVDNNNSNNYKNNDNNIINNTSNVRIMKRKRPRPHSKKFKCRKTRKTKRDETAIKIDTLINGEEVEVAEEFSMLDTDGEEHQNVDQFVISEDISVISNTNFDESNIVTNSIITDTRLNNTNQRYSVLTEERRKPGLQLLGGSELDNLHDNTSACHDANNSLNVSNNLNLDNIHQEFYNNIASDGSLTDVAASVTDPVSYEPLEESTNQELEISEVAELEHSENDLYSEISEGSSILESDVEDSEDDFNFDGSKESTNQELEISEVSELEHSENDLYSEISEESSILGSDVEDSEDDFNFEESKESTNREFIPNEVSEVEDSGDDLNSEGSEVSHHSDPKIVDANNSSLTPVNSILDSIDESDTTSESSEESSKNAENPLNRNQTSPPDLNPNNNHQNLNQPPPPAKPSDISTIISGCRIICFHYFWNNLKDFGLSKNHQPNCSRKLENIDIYGKLDIGLNTLIYVRCTECKILGKLYTNPPKPENKFNINETAAINVIGSVCTFAGFQTTLAVFDIPYISHNAYQKHRKKLIIPLKQTLDYEMHQNALKEIEIAIKNGDVTSNGTPLIKIITDGFYGKRSFVGGKHDALGGVVAIIGCATEKVIDIEVLSKYCYTCWTYKNRNLPPPKHKCYMNYDREKTSSSMEPFATVKLFNWSLKLHGVVYETMVSDDDSSTLKAIYDSNPYASLGIKVKRIKCSNHLFRAMGKKIREASKITFPKKRIPGTVRKRIRFSGLKIRKIITFDIERLRKEFNKDNLSKDEKHRIFLKNTEILRNNIVISPYHVFGDHSTCPAEWSCDKLAKNHLTQIKKFDLFSRIEKIMTDLSQNADHLLYFLTTNKVEQFHGILAKYFLGKRVQFGGADEFQDRVYMGALDQTTSGHNLSKFYEFCKKVVPERVSKLEIERNMQRLTNKKCREANKKKKKVRRVHGTKDKNYGENSAQPDLSETNPDVYQKCKEDHHNKLRQRQNNRTIIERETQNFPFAKLHSYEKDLIPSFFFGKICRMLETTSCAPVVSNICHPVEYDDDVLQSMESNRDEALGRLESVIGEKINCCGLFLSNDKENFYLCARPDGLISTNTIVIVANVSEDEGTMVDNALESNKNMRNLFMKDSPNLVNIHHPVYYIIQGQLLVTEKEFCYFAVYTPTDLKTAELIKKDDEFWSINMKTKLERFYYHSLIDEIIDSRKQRSMPIREASFTVEARAKRDKKLSDTLAKKQQQQSSASQNSVDTITHHYDIETINNYRNTVLNQSFEEYQENILANDSYLNDISISRFLLLLENRDFTIHFPITILNPIKDSLSNNDLLILGGHQTNQHWCCLHCNGEFVHIYDSLNRDDFTQMSKVEQNYIKIRYPIQFEENKIVFNEVTRQPDGSSCGVYAAAFATTIALGGNPSEWDYSKDAAVMRQHLLFQIIDKNELVEFPRTPRR